MQHTRSIAAVLFSVLALGLANVQAQRSDRERQQKKKSFGCDDCYRRDRYESFCEVRDLTLDHAPRALDVDGRENGGVSVKGWDNKNVLIHARVQARADTEREARDMVSMITVETDGGRVRANGPSERGSRNWSVSYEIYVPHRTDLSLRTHNGGIGISQVEGRIDFEALNGGVSLNDLAGNVRGKTTNGGLSIQLRGDRWEGEGLDAQTTNGGVSLRNIPAPVSRSSGGATCLSERSRFRPPTVLQTGHPFGITRQPPCPFYRQVIPSGFQSKLKWLVS